MALITPKAKKPGRGILGATPNKPGTGTGVLGSSALPAPAVPQPTQPAAPAPAPAPPDPIQQQRQILLQRTFDDTNAALDQQTQQINQAYGFNDTSNPFSRAALLQQAYVNRQRGTTNQLAARGQLYSGAANRQRALDTRNNDIAVDSTRRAFEAAIAQIGQRRTAARTAFDTGSLEAAEQARDRALSEAPDASSLPPEQQQDLTSDAPVKAPAPSDAKAGKKRRKKTDPTTKALKALRLRGLL